MTGDLPVFKGRCPGSDRKQIEFRCDPDRGGVAGVRGRESVDNKERAKRATTHGEGQGWMDGTWIGFREGRFFQRLGVR